MAPNTRYTPTSPRTSLSESGSGGLICLTSLEKVNKSDLPMVAYILSVLMQKPFSFGERKARILRS